MEEIKKETPLQYDKLTKILFDAPKERDVSAVKFLSPYSKFSMIINLMMSLCVKNALEKDGIFFCTWPWRAVQKTCLCQKNQTCLFRMPMIPVHTRLLFVTNRWL